MGTVTQLELKPFGLRHPRLGARVFVVKPWWLPRGLAWLYDKNIGKDGCVISVDKGPITNEILYSVMFESSKGIEHASYMAYFEHSIVFTTSGIFRG